MHYDVDKLYITTNKLMRIILDHKILYYLKTDKKKELGILVTFWNIHKINIKTHKILKSNEAKDFLYAYPVHGYKKGKLCIYIDIQVLPVIK